MLVLKHTFCKKRTKKIVFEFGKFNHIDVNGIIRPYYSVFFDQNCVKLLRFLEVSPKDGPRAVSNRIWFIPRIHFQNWDSKSEQSFGNLNQNHLPEMSNSVKLKFSVKCAKFAEFDFIRYYLFVSWCPPENCRIRVEVWIN